MKSIQRRTVFNPKRKKSFKEVQETIPDEKFQKVRDDIRAIKTKKHYWLESRKDQIMYKTVSQLVKKQLLRMKPSFMSNRDVDTLILNNLFDLTEGFVEDQPEYVSLEHIDTVVNDSQRVYDVSQVVHFISKEDCAEFVNKLRDADIRVIDDALKVMKEFLVPRMRRGFFRGCQYDAEEYEKLLLLPKHEAYLVKFFESQDMGHDMIYEFVAEGEIKEVHNKDIDVLYACPVPVRPNLYHFTKQEELDKLNERSKKYKDDYAENYKATQEALENGETPPEPHPHLEYERIVEEFGRSDVVELEHKPELDLEVRSKVQIGFSLLFNENIIAYKEAGTYKWIKKENTGVFYEWISKNRKPISFCDSLILESDIKLGCCLMGPTAFYFEEQRDKSFVYDSVVDLNKLIWKVYGTYDVDAMNIYSFSKFILNDNRPYYRWRVAEQVPFGNAKGYYGIKENKLVSLNVFEEYKRDEEVEEMILL